MKIEVYNLNKVLKEVERCPGCNLLSIRDAFTDDATHEKYACLDRRVARNGVNMLTINFDDIDPYRFYHGMEHPSIKDKFKDGQLEPIFFNSQIAGDIMRWVLDIWSADKDCTIKIHCWAGRSRSQAVAYWLNMYFNLIVDRNLDDYYDNNIRNVTEKVHFNCEVLRVFTETFG